MDKRKYLKNHKKFSLATTASIMTILSFFSMNVQAADEATTQQADVIVEENIQNDEQSKKDEELEIFVEEEQVDTYSDETEAVEALEPYTEETEIAPLNVMSLHQDEASLSLGNTSVEIKQFKEDLMAAGFTTWSNPSAYYGSETVRFVEDFQKYYGLPATGEGDAATLAQLSKVLTSPYQLGNRSPEIQKIKVRLMNLGYTTWSNPNDNFGGETVEFVKDFQRANGLVANGIVEEKTYAKLNQFEEVESTRLSIGSKGPSVKAFKDNLMAAGFTTWSNPSNYYGAETAKFVKDFQKAYGLQVTGVADQTTINQLESLVKNSYQLGNNSPEIQELKIMLRDLGFANWSNPGGNFGRETAQAVEDFQKYYGIIPTGIIDKITYDKLHEVSHAPMSIGLKRPDVQRFKEDLTAIGFTTWTNPSDYYGAETAKFVKDFQKYYGLQADGIAGQATIAQLDKVKNSPYQLGKSSTQIRKIKEDLTALGFTSWTNPGNSFGSETVKFVKNFQKYYNLVPNGIVDEVTLAKINSLLKSVPVLGESSSEIFELKTALMKTGFAPNWSVPTNVYDNETAEAIKVFQAYYGLISNGLIDERTANKINEVANSPYQSGKNSPEILKVKRDLMTIGFAPDWNDPNGTYGPATVANVTNFQSYYGLKQNGIIDSVTMAKINSIINSPYQLGKSSAKIRNLKKDLHELGFAPNWTNPTNYFDQTTKTVVENFQRAYQLPVSGIAEETTLALIATLQDPGATTNYGITLKEALNMQMRANPQTDRHYAYISTNYVDNYNKVTAASLNVRSGAGTNKAIIGSLPKGTTVKILEKVDDNWYRIEYQAWAWVDAARADVEYYLNPRNFVSDSQQKYQFLNLSRLSGATPAELNRFLQGKGILEGMGEAFIEAGRTYGVNEVYLLSHALLETGHGTSALARGIEVNGVTVYNMFGIGAYDNDPDRLGSQRAYENGWTTPELAIIGGAEFIGGNYIREGQNTLYKMRWNPAAMNRLGYASHQYATDMGWASKQVNSIYSLYQHIGINGIYLDIPIYK